MSDKIYTPNSEIEESPGNAAVEETVQAAKQTENGATKKVSFLRRFSSIRSTVTPNLQVVRKRVRKLNCFKLNEDDECDIPMMDMPRHKSIDISVGLARRASLFLFRRKSVCMHPYHPYTPKATCRKIYFGADVKKYAE